MRSRLRFDLDRLETRDGADGAFTVEGHAAVFDQLSDDLGGFREQIQRGAFRKILSQNPDVLLLWNHDPNYVLARTKNSTLRLNEDQSGLKIAADVSPTSYAADLRTLVQRGDVDQMSFAFHVGADNFDASTDEENIRTITEFRALYDTSIVAQPAYPQTDVQWRSEFRQIEFISNAEREADEAARIHARERHRAALRSRAALALSQARD